MPKTLYSLFAVLFLLVLFSTSFAQDIKTSSGNKVNPVYVDGTGALLYDQTYAVGAGTIASQQFSDFPTYSCQSADDFVITDPAGWTIDQIVAMGQPGLVPFPQALVEFYNNNAGLPGTVVDSRTTSITDAGGTLTINLAPAVVLPAGTYWVSVSVVGDFATYGQWFQYTHTSNNNSLWCWQNPGGGFGSPCSSWGQHTSCFPGSYTDNDLTFALYGFITPVELTSFTATSNENAVVLNWSTASETNNQGFSIERSSGGEYEAIGFVQGHGTTTEAQVYAFTDRNVNVGSYTYRLKQIDFDGSFEYSSVVEADVVAPDQYALGQNYPNPFNPSTKISFSLAADSKVMLKVFNVLGEEVATLLNENMAAGLHEINFDASNVNTGVYLYRIEASGIDGTNFVDIKKMILTK